jgi:hypothetical protein
MEPISELNEEQVGKVQKIEKTSKPSQKLSTPSTPSTPSKPSPNFIIPFPIPIRFPCILLPGVGLRTLSRLPPAKEYPNLQSYQSVQLSNQLPFYTIGTAETMLWGLTFRNLGNFCKVLQHSLLHDVVEYDNEYRRYILNQYVMYLEWYNWFWGNDGKGNKTGKK